MGGSWQPQVNGADCWSTRTGHMAQPLLRGALCHTPSCSTAHREEAGLRVTSMVAPAGSVGQQGLGASASAQLPQGQGVSCQCLCQVHNNSPKVSECLSALASSQGRLGPRGCAHGPSAAGCSLPCLVAGTHCEMPTATNSPPHNAASLVWVPRTLQDPGGFALGHC